MDGVIPLLIILRYLPFLTMKRCQMATIEYCSRFSPLNDEESLNADSHHDSLYDILKQYGKDFSNISCLIGDNCAVNQSLAKKCSCYMVECARDRLNLSIQKYLAEFSDIFESIRAVMIFLRKIKPRAALKAKTHLSPVLD